MLEAARWDQYDGPATYEPSSVAAALELLAESSTLEEGWEAYNAVLFAIGNNHAGTYYPAVIGALPILVDMTQADRPWARFAAVQVLIECAWSFQPEPGFETSRLPGGRVCSVADEVKNQLETARSRFLSRLDEESHPEVCAALGHLLERIAPDPGAT